MSLPATSVNPGAGPSLQPEVAALAQLAFASSTPAATRVAAGGLAAAFATASADALDLDLSDPEQCHFGDYTLRAKLGQGGMGVVYRAQQHSLDREVAVKLLAAGPWASPGFIERFRLEAQSAARMQHPNIVTIHEIGEQDGLPFFSMRLVRGQSLAERVTRGGALSARNAAAMLRTVAEAVDYAHRLGVLHLDLKPGNVLIDEQGEPMVADFGLARRLEETLAGVEEVSGTPSYMAPEQATAGGRIGVATDVYALGATLYEALTARPPFRGSTARETLEQVVRTLAPAPRMFDRAIPLDLQAICMRCLSKDPGRALPECTRVGRGPGRFPQGTRGQGASAESPAEVVAPGPSRATTERAGDAVRGVAAGRTAGHHGAVESRRCQCHGCARACGASGRRLPKARWTPVMASMGCMRWSATSGEMEASGSDAAAMVERQRIGTLLANAPQLVDRIPIEAGQVITSVALSPDSARVAIATHWQDGRRSVRHYEIASGRELWSTSTDGLTRNLAMAQGAPHGRLRFSADGARIIVSLMQQPVFAAPGTADEIALDAQTGRVLQPAELPSGHSDMVYDDNGSRAIVRARTNPSLRFPDRFRLSLVDGWQPVGPWHDDAASMWLFAPDGGWLLRTLDFVRFEAVDFGTLAPRWSLQLPEGQMIRAWRFAPDGSILALGALDGSVLLVDVANGKTTSLPSAPWTPCAGWSSMLPVARWRHCRKPVPWSPGTWRRGARAVHRYWPGRSSNLAVYG
ncbi:MAG: protein kinase [Rhodanobacteraceae bacterium]|nr:protein kinase [Rhodanobacteraceae bacterium]